MSVTNKSNSPISVIVTGNITEIFDKYKQVNNLNEACGILIGTHSIDGSKITITCATEPDCNDKRSRFSFKLKSKNHNKTLQNRFSKSGNREVYLGTWHTHSENYPKPSICDTNDWLKQYSINKYLFEKMIFVIVGIRFNNWFIVSKDGVTALNNNISIQHEKRN